VQKPFTIRESCPACGVLFKREEGFFVGAILVNTVTTEIVILMVYLISVAIALDVNRSLLLTLLALAVTFPILFYHHSWSIWLGFDHLVESLLKPPAT